MRDVVAAAGEPDAALANHLIMGPAILARAGLRFAIKVHGSDISYTVRPHPDRFVPYAREGTDAAAGPSGASRRSWSEQPFVQVELSRAVRCFPLTLALRKATQSPEPRTPVRMPSAT